MLKSKVIKLASTRKISTNCKSLEVTKDGALTLIGLNRPEVRNCVNNELASNLHRAIKEFEDDDEQKVGVLYGVGGNFCAGYDLKELSNATEEFAGNINENGTMGPTLKLIKKPLVAAISGYAVAGGFELALLCDLRVVEETAVMGVYNRRFGVPLIDGGTVRLQAMVGLSRALDIILTGRSIDAKEAYQIGIANRLVAHGTALGQAIQLATSIVKFPQQCLSADRKSTYNAAFSSSYETLLKWEQEHGIPIILEEAIEGAKKFASGMGRHGKTYHLVEKKIPDWEKEENTKSKL